jgi:hypothetical protein
MTFQLVVYNSPTSLENTFHVGKGAQRKAFTANEVSGTVRAGVTPKRHRHRAYCSNLFLAEFPCFADHFTISENVSRRHVCSDAAYLSAGWH